MTFVQRCDAWLSLGLAVCAGFLFAVAILAARDPWLCVVVATIELICGGVLLQRSLPADEGGL